MQLVLALIIFVITYAAILSGRVDKTAAALLGGMCMILLHIVHEDKAFAAIDMTVVLLLTGMMIISHFLARSGFFGYVAVKFAQLAQGRPLPLLLILCTVTAVLSALIDNVTTVLLIAPVTFLMAEQLEVSPIPFLLFEVMAANIGGTATLIGDPPNILIGSRAGLSFNEFLFHLGPVAVLSLGMLLIVAVFVMRKSAFVPADVRARIMEMQASRAITDKSLLIKSCAVLGAVLIGFVLHGVFHIGPATIAMAGAAALLILTRANPEDAFKAVEWPTLFFFIGLFVTVEGLAESGVIGKAAEAALSATGGSAAAASIILLWFSGLTAAFVGAIPMVTALIPLVQQIIPGIAEASHLDPETTRYALWWSLALGACLGGNGTVFGAAANIVVVEIARNNRREISFPRFMAIGMPIMAATLLISSVYLMLRYL